MQRYVPPHLKNKQSSEAGSTEQRSLDFQHHVSQATLLVPCNSNIQLTDIPVELEADDGPNPDERPQGFQVYTLYHPDKVPDELLDWLKDALGDVEARLEFPTQLSKAERAKWHHLAQKKGLRTESKGVGEDRFLSIGSRPPLEEGGVGGARAAALSRAQRHRAQQIYDFCQLEGGRFWDYSKGELEELVASGWNLPEDLAEMVARREQGARVSQLLRQGDPAQALQLLFDNPRLAWHKDDFSGGYPIHIATFKGYVSVVEFLASLPNVVEQRDGQRETPLAIAMRRGNLDVQQLLLAAGADPQHANFHREVPKGGGEARAAGSCSSDEGREEYVSWNRAERRAYKHGGEGGATRRQSQEGRRSLDAGSTAQRGSLDGRGGKGSGAGGRRRSVDFHAHAGHCPW